MNRKTQAVVEEVRKATGGRGVDRIVEVAFDENIQADADMLAVGGAIATYSAGPVPQPPIPFFTLMRNSHTVHFVLVYTMGDHAHDGAIRDVTACLEAGAFRTHVGGRLPSRRGRRRARGAGLRRDGRQDPGGRVRDAGLWALGSMSNLLSQLTKSEQARLLEELNYMNLAEIRGFCSERGIPYRIVAEHSNGQVKVTKDTDRKPIVLARVRRYLTTGQAGPPTRISAKIVREENPPTRLEPRDRLYYRWYAKEFEGVMRLLRELTGGRFRDGAVARVVAMEFWTRGEAPTFEKFARSWTKAKAEETSCSRRNMPT